jgi:uncharacterized protein (DUF4415 family)
MNSEQWLKFLKMSDAEITRRAKADPDAQPIPARALKHFVLTPPHVKKKSITIRVDEDVLGWYKSQGENYQKRMNHALRKWMQDEPQRREDWGAKPAPKAKPKKR